MPIGFRHSHKLSISEFTNREYQTETFQKKLRNIQAEKYQVLVYYGIGGIGKSRLRKELTKQLDNKSDGYKYGLIDFDLPGFRQAETGMFQLRKELKQKYKIPFPTFDLEKIFLVWSIPIRHSL